MGLTLDTALVEELLETVDGRVGNDDAMIEALAPLLDHRQVQPLVEYLGRRLRLASGHQQVTFEFSEGRLHRSGFAHRPVGNQELEEIARPRLAA